MPITLIYGFYSSAISIVYLLTWSYNNSTSKSTLLIKTNEARIIDSEYILSNNLWMEFHTPGINIDIKHLKEWTREIRREI